MDAILDYTELPRMTEAKIAELRAQHAELRYMQALVRRLPDGHMRAKDAMKVLMCGRSSLRRWSKRQPFEKGKPFGFYPEAEVRAEAERRRARGCR